MFVLIPYQIETLEQERPWVNWLIVGACVFVSTLAIVGVLSEDLISSLVLDGFSLPGLLGHVLLHLGLFHLIGNMVFLWVFGNAICTNTNNVIYAFTFLLCTLVAASIHVIMDGSLAVGASGAINGIVGIVFAMYPINRVYLFWLVFFKGGTVSTQAWTIIIAWFLFDVFGVAMGGGSVAYWAHMGGFLGGVIIGLVALHFRWFELTEYDNRSLLQIIKREYPE